MAARPKVTEFSGKIGVSVIWKKLTQSAVGGRVRFMYVSKAKLAFFLTRDCTAEDR